MKKKETVEEFLARGGKITKVPTKQTRKCGYTKFSFSDTRVTSFVPKYGKAFLKKKPKTKA